MSVYSHIVIKLIIAIMACRLFWFVSAINNIHHLITEHNNMHQSIVALISYGVVGYVYDKLHH